MLLIAVIIIPVIAGIAVGIIKMAAPLRRIFLACALLLTDVLSLAVLSGNREVKLVTFSENVNLAFAPDGLGKFFMLAAVILYTAVLFYAFEYMKHEEDEERFFAFYMVSFGFILAMAMSDNLVTMYFCFEMLTLTTVPLVLHEMTKEAVAAGLKYLFYSVAGALFGLFAVFFAYYYAADPSSFVTGGFLDPMKTAGHETVILAAVMAGIIGFGTKAGLYPMHGWLPTAHPIAPAPGSALLSGIIAKAGVIAIIRLVYYSFGPDFIRGTWVQTAWMSLAMLTVFMGSMMAYREKILKKRLAYSTISQISYILLGLSFLEESGLRGGLIHLMSHVAAKGCLFLAAGVFIVKLGIRDVRGLKGVGKKLPVTLWCLTIAALSLVGIPPFGGFLSKWVIAETAVGSGIPFFQAAAPVVLLISALLTAGYLLTITVEGFFPGHGEEHAGPEDEGKAVRESCLMTVPMAALCALSLIMGLFGTRITGFFGF